MKNAKKVTSSKAKKTKNTESKISVNFLITTKLHAKLKRIQRINKLKTMSETGRFIFASL